MAQIRIVNDRNDEPVALIPVRFSEGRKPSEEAVYDALSKTDGSQGWPIPHWPRGDYTLHVNKGDYKNPAFDEVEHFVPAAEYENDIIVRLTRPSLPVPTWPVRTGVVMADGRGVRDDQGFFLPRGITLFTWPWGAQHEEDRYRQNMGWLAERRFDFVRTWGKVGGAGSWADREINPAAPDYVEAYGRAIDIAYDEYHVRLDISYMADNFDNRDPMEGARKLAEVVRTRQHKVIILEAANEDNMPGESVNLPLVTKFFRQEFPQMLVVARSAPGSPAEHLYHYANMASIHSDRTPPAERQARQMWDAQGLSVVSGSMEPPGPWSSGQTQDDPMHIGMTATVCSIVGSAFYVAHLGPGIRSGGAWDRARGIPANLWETPRADDIARAVINGRDLLPPDVCNWRRANGHWQAPMPEHPLPAKYVWSDFPVDDKPTSPFNNGVSRTYAAERGDQFVCAMLAVKGQSVHYARRNCHVTSYNILTREVVDERDVRGGVVRSVNDAAGRRVMIGDGDPYTLKGPSVGGLWGYVIVGQYL